jgi:hypothetical protein
MDDGGMDTLGNTPENKPKRAKLTPQMEAAKWKPGQSGNPSGRPVRKPITEMYEEILNDPQMIAEIKAATFKALRHGNMAMVLQLKEMADRVEGKVMLPIEADVSVNLADAIAAARKRAGK